MPVGRLLLATLTAEQNAILDAIAFAGWKPHEEWAVLRVMKILEQLFTCSTTSNRSSWSTA
jgi:hypothetical protein